jgi:hypothetical protein
VSTFDDLARRFELRRIRNCPGRFIIRKAPPELTPRELLGSEAEIHTFNVFSARDAVLVVRLDRGGLISYQRADGTYLHTLNDDDGFERKLRDLGIEI